MLGILFISLSKTLKCVLFWQNCISSTSMEMSWFHFQSWFCQITSGCRFLSPWSCVFVPLSPGVSQAWAHSSVHPTVLLIKEKNQPGTQLKDVKDNEKKKICHLARHVFIVIFPSVSSLYWFKGCLSWCFIIYRKEKNRLTKLCSLNKDTVNSKKLNLKDMWIFHVVCQAVMLGWWL